MRINLNEILIILGRHSFHVLKRKRGLRRIIFGVAAENPQVIRSSFNYYNQSNKIV